MNVSIKSLSSFGKGNNDGVLGGLKTLSKEDVFAQTKYFSNSNDLENWQIITEEEHNDYIEEYD